MGKKESGTELREIMKKRNEYRKRRSEREWKVCT